MQHTDGTPCAGDRCAWKGDGGHEVTFTRPVVVVRPNHKPEVVELPERDTLSFLYGAIGCSTVDLVRLPEHEGHSLDCWIDDEGKFSGADVNPIATMLAWRVGAIPARDYIVGTVVYTSSTWDGDTAPLTPGLLDLFRVLM